ncbi:urease accessory protein UreF [Pseudorhizobium endolithicum]|uniref:Urease accessory protein UreF n=1 Tax=Pseudorhizobium endolithicum TaxID=1191678 RepID=A0ABM8PVG4_9HYPH|nr:urease accessory protein UreF [Pseudorhizobium endolithicum]CAD7050591.1 urease accessory protein UreF [Pseudorhizobium endolithicum]
MGEGLRTQALLRLMAWMSPAFPIGGFAWSGGLERAVHDGLVRDAPGLRAWLAAVLRHGSLWNDAILFAEAWRRHDDHEALRNASDLGLALAGSAERHFETLSLGQAFVSAAHAWPNMIVERLPKEVPFPIAVGAVAAAHAVPLREALAVYLHAALSQAVSAGIRLGACGQTEGVAILAALEAEVVELASRASGSGLDDLGAAGIQAEIASLRHETQNSRLFRS